MLHFIGVYDYTVILTYLSLLSAVVGMIQTANGRFTAGVLCLFFCGICDAFDGAVARTKKNRTEDEKGFGIQLDSLCDVISFGFFPAMWCYYMGMNGAIGVLIIFLYCMCAVCRLAFFNVLEVNRQKIQEGGNKIYRGLPVTSISLILPVLYPVIQGVSGVVAQVILHVMLAAVGFFFVLDFQVRKPDFRKLLKKV